MGPRPYQPLPLRGPCSIAGLYKNDISVILFYALLNSSKGIFAITLTLLVMLIDISTIKKTLMRLYWGWVISIEHAPSNWPKRHMSAVETSLLSILQFVQERLRNGGPLLSSPSVVYHTVMMETILRLSPLKKDNFPFTNLKVLVAVNHSPNLCNVHT